MFINDYAVCLCDAGPHVKHEVVGHKLNACFMSYQYVAHFNELALRKNS